MFYTVDKKLPVTFVQCTVEVKTVPIFLLLFSYVLLYLDYLDLDYLDYLKRPSYII
jgi:hypothetical protein